MSAQAAFGDFIASRLGCEPPRLLEPGRFVRFPTNGKRGDDAGWAKLFPDGESGIVGDFRSGEAWTWHAKRERPYTEAEQRAWRERIDRERKEAQALRERAEKEAAERARTHWDKGQPVPAEHAYLAAKRVRAHGLKLYRGPITISGMRCDGALMVPIRNAAGELQSLEFISADGEKRFLSGGRKSGGYLAIGKPNGVLCIAEGYATAASIREATGHAVAVAFDAGNLEAVAVELRAKLPKVSMIMCADDDKGTPGNPGLREATEAARRVGALLAVPDFGPERPEGATDFNDLATLRGPEAVVAALKAARLPDAGTAAPTGSAEAPKARSAEKKSESPLIYCKLSTIEAKPIRWLWPGRIARGKVSMIAGHPGLGKSQITSSLAAIVTKGGRWPVDRTPCERGTVLFLSAEDDPADTIRPRLEAAGADLERVHILQAVRDGFTSTGDEVQRAFNLKEDVRRLEETLVEIGDVALVIIDPVSAYLGGADSHNNAEVRALLAPLAEMAARQGVAVLAVSHLNKGGAGSSDALLRVTGSLAFVAAARAAFIVAKDPENEKRRLFLPAKNNIGADIGGLAFGIEGCSIGRGIETSRVVWEADPVNGLSADELLRTPTDPEDRSEIEEACDWLRVALSDGAVEARELFKLGESQGFHKRAVQRARQRIGADTRRDGFGKGSKVVWFMPAKPSIGDNKPIDDTAKSVSPMGKAVTYDADSGRQDGDDEVIL